RIALFAPLLGTGGTQRHLQQVVALLDPARFPVEGLTLRAGGAVDAELRAGGVSGRSPGVGARLASAPTLPARVAAARGRGGRRGRWGAGGSTSFTAISGGRRWWVQSRDGSPACRSDWPASGASRARIGRQSVPGGTSPARSTP